MGSAHNYKVYSSGEGQVGQQHARRRNTMRWAGVWARTQQRARGWSNATMTYLAHVFMREGAEQAHTLDADSRNFGCAER